MEDTLQWVVLGVCAVYLLCVVLICALFAVPCLGFGVHRLAQRAVLALSVQMVTRVAVLVTFIVAPPNESVDVARGIVFNMLNDVPDLLFYLATLLLWISLSDATLVNAAQSWRALSLLPLGIYTVLSFVVCIVEIGDDALTVPETAREDVAIGLFCVYDAAVAACFAYLCWRLRHMESEVFFCRAAMSRRRANVAMVGLPLLLLVRLALHAPQPFIGVRDLSLQPASTLTVAWQAGTNVAGDLAIGLFLLVWAIQPRRAVDPRKYTRALQAALLEQEVRGRLTHGYALPRDALVQGERVGKGGYGVVYRGTLYGGVAVAMKRLDMHVRLSDEGSAEFLDEIQLLAQLRHPSIVQFIGFSIHEQEESVAKAYGVPPVQGPFVISLFAKICVYSFVCSFYSRGCAIVVAPFLLAPHKSTSSPSLSSAAASATFSRSSRSSTTRAPSGAGRAAATSSRRCAGRRCGRWPTESRARWRTSTRRASCTAI